MHRNVEVVIGRLVTDPALLSRFAKQPFEVLYQMRLELTDVEIEALAAIDPEAFRALAAALDPRLRKATLSTEKRFPNETDPLEPGSGTKKEEDQ